jgi:pimeloyl-ACP methyl ester carboxylesterase
VKRVVAVVTTAGLVAGGAVFASIAQASSDPAAAKVSAAPSIPAFTPAPITWNDCRKADSPPKTEPELENPFEGLFDVECGTLVVPLDYLKPKGKKIKLAVQRVNHTVPARKYQGALLLNPGGPGSSGLDLAFAGLYLPEEVAGAYDWIGFDPRGVGSSRPALSCDGNYFKAPRPKYVPTTAKLEKTWLARTKAYAEACDKNGGALLDHVKTIDTVNDMESLRKALGEKKINFYGFSYGTYLGQVYSTVYPNRVRRMILDGVVNPHHDWYRGNLKQNRAFERTVKVYFAWLAKHNARLKLGRTAAKVEKLYYSTMAELNQKPAGGKLGGDELNDAFLRAGYEASGWPDLAEDFAGYVHKGDWKPLYERYTAHNDTGKGADNNYAMYLATQCTDSAWPKSWSRWRADNWAVHAEAPFQTWSNAWFNAPCLNWGAKAGTPVKVDGSKTPPMLLINETRDGATPYSGALQARKAFPKSSLVEGVGGTTHGSSLGGTDCTDNAVAAYLAKGKLPTRKAGNGSDLKCPAAPIGEFDDAEQETAK